MNKDSFVYKAYCLIVCFVWVVGTIGGVGYAAYCHAWFIMVCVILLGAMASEYAIYHFKQLLA